MCIRDRNTPAKPSPKGTTALLKILLLVGSRSRGMMGFFEPVSYTHLKEEFELNQVFPFNKYIFQEARKVGYELKKTRWFDEVFENCLLYTSQLH